MRREDKIGGRDKIAFRVLFPTPCVLSRTGEHEVSIAYAKDWTVLGVQYPCQSQKDTADVAYALAVRGEHPLPNTCVRTASAFLSQQLNGEANEIFRIPELPVRARLSKSCSVSTAQLASIMRQELRGSFVAKVNRYLRKTALMVDFEINHDLLMIVARGYLTLAEYKWGGVWQICRTPNDWPVRDRYSNRCPVCDRVTRDRFRHEKTVLHKTNQIALVAWILNDISSWIHPTLKERNNAETQS